MVWDKLVTRYQFGSYHGNKITNQKKIISILHHLNFFIGNFKILTVAKKFEIFLTLQKGQATVSENYGTPLEHAFSLILKSFHTVCSGSIDKII